MLTFKQFILEKTEKPFTGTSGCYSSLLLSSQSVTRIASLCDRMGVPFTQRDEIHCTVVYSPDAVPAHIPVPKNMPIHAKGIGFELFGPDKDCVVLLIESAELKALNAKFVQAGAVPTYAEYRPHITIAKIDSGSGKQYPRMKFMPIDIELVSMTIEDIVKKRD